MSGILDSDAVTKLKEDLPEVVKTNKGALVGALVGYFISDNEKAKSVLLGAIAGALVDKCDK